MLSRIEKLINNIGEGRAAFISGGANIRYYSGFTSGDAFLIISADRRMLITDSRYYVQARQQSQDFDLVKLEDGWEKIFASVPEREIAFEENIITCGFYDRLKKKAEKKSFIRMQKEIEAPRRNKDASEIRLISEAEEIGSRAFMHIIEVLHAGMTERDVALKLEYYMKKQGATALSFDTIAASGVRSSMPHGTATDKVIEKGELLTLDFGCVYEGYCSDMTRTVVIGVPDAKQKEIYDIVLTAQTAAIEGLYQGIACSEADELARRVIREAGYGDSFGHSLGHSVGLEIHESPNFSPKSRDELENGNVLSVEPGIYIDGWGGVRIEDLIAVADGRIVNLTTAPKNLIRI